MAYTYLIGWSKNNKYYYGVRFSKNCHPSELWVSYFTSSKHVNNYRKEFGEPDIVQIRKVFNTADEARIWETKVLKKLNVINEEKWLNKTDNISISLEASRLGTKNQIGKVVSEETKKKISKSHLGKKRSLDSRKKQSKTMSGSGNHFYGKTHSEDFKKRQSEKQKIKQLGFNNTRAIAIKYNNKIYGTIKEAVEKTGLSYYKIHELIKTKEIEKVV